MLNSKKDNEKRGIYIHIPFCYKKCNYCDFYSLPSLSLAKNYTDALCRSINEFGKQNKIIEIDSIFIGGGTPSAIDEGMIGAIFNELYKNFDIDSNCEISIEANPATVDESKLLAYRSFGINRISFGMQSAIDEELKILGRMHNYKDFVSSYDLARKCGFENINIDVMTGIPLQNEASLRKTLESVVFLDPAHISVYMLKIEPGTPFYRDIDSLPLPDEDSVCEMYFTTEELLSSYGFEQYEISNFAKKGFECSHNIKYWQGTEYVGFGTGAHSYFRSERYSYKKDIDGYINCKDFYGYRTDIQYIDENEKDREKLIFGIRMKKGIDLSCLKNYDCKDKIEMYKKNGYCIIKNNRLSLTVKGMLISNYIISDILLQEKKQ